MKSGKLGKLSFTETGELGIYRVAIGRKDNRSIRRESVRSRAKVTSGRIARLSIKVGDVEVKGESVWQAARKEIWKTVVLIGLAVLLVEWYIYNRRIY